MMQKNKSIPEVERAKEKPDGGECLHTANGWNERNGQQKKHCRQSLRGPGAACQMKQITHRAHHQFGMEFPR
jgi:hypothetical protein